MADSATQAAQPEGLDRETLIVAGVVMLGAVMSILDTTVVNVAIPTTFDATQLPISMISRREMAPAAASRAINLAMCEIQG